MTRNSTSLSFVASQAQEAQEARNELIAIYGNTDPEEADVIVALGGDGFMLQTLHTTMNSGKRVYGMNRGSIGFLMNRYDTRNLQARIETAVENAFRPLEMTTSDASGQERRALAITDGKRDAKFAELPTMKEAGFPDFESYVWTSFYVHSKTPDAVVKKLADTMRDALNTPESKARVAARPGRELNLHTKAMGDFQRTESDRFKKVIQAAGL